MLITSKRHFRDPVNHRESIAIRIEFRTNEVKLFIRDRELLTPSNTIYWCNIGPIYSQGLDNENILGIYWTNIASMNCATRDVISF